MDIGIGCGICYRQKMKRSKKVKLKRTQTEIVKRIKERKDQDFFGFEINDYLAYLNFKHAKQFLGENAKEREWGPETLGPEERIRDYMAFAWDKANHKRGLSAGRSISHMIAWLWLDGQDEFLSANNLDDYEFYGKPHLIAICELYGIDHTEYDDGVREND